MPGIVAILGNLPHEKAVEQLEQMLATLRHEPFYTSGTFVDRESGVYVGWTARAGSFSDGMPLRNESSNRVLVFSGEEFPDPSSIAGLKKGQPVSSRAHYLVHQYEQDSAFPKALNGRFHGLALDRTSRTAMVFNDRFGMHKLYFHETSAAIYLAAEAKAILQVCPETREFDAKGLAEFIACSAVLENRSVFRGVEALPPASAWSFENGRLRNKGSYFHPSEWEQQEKLGLEPYYSELKDVFYRNLPRYFAGDQAIAMSLTGGLDTRMILAAHMPEPGTLPCYTFGSMFRENHDVRVAKRVAAVCRQPHQVVTAGNEFLQKFSHYAERAIYLSDGCVDVSRCPDLYLNERAREIAPVRMTGNYGGEILRGVRGFKPDLPDGGLYQPEFLSHLRQTCDTYERVLSKNKVSFAAFQQAPWFHHGVLSLEQTQVAMRSPFLDNEFVRTVSRAPESSLASTEASLRLIREGNPELASIPTDRGVGGRQTGALGRLSRAALEFSFKAEYAYDMGMPQWLARCDHSLKALQLERLFLGRHKPFHFRVWYRDVLGDYLKQMLLDSRALTRPYVNRKGVESVVIAHTKGVRNHTNEIHKLLTLELMHRLFLDRPARGGTLRSSEGQLTIA